MKKKYVQPACYVVEMETAGIICASDGVSLGTTGSTGLGGFVQNQTSSTYSAWDDTEK